MIRTSESITGSKKNKHWCYFGRHLRTGKLIPHSLGRHYHTYLGFAHSVLSFAVLLLPFPSRHGYHCSYSCRSRFYFRRWWTTRCHCPANHTSASTTCTHYTPNGGCRISDTCHWHSDCSRSQTTRQCIRTCIRGILQVCTVRGRPRQSLQPTLFPPYFHRQCCHQATERRRSWIPSCWAYLQLTPRIRLIHEIPQNYHRKGQRNGCRGYGCLLRSPHMYARTSQSRPLYLNSNLCYKT